MLTDLINNVNNGVFFLDSIKPGWYKKIDLEIFDIEECHRCILGQLFGDYFIAITNFRIDFDGEYPLEHEEKNQFTLGFSLESKYYLYFPLLTYLWEQVIKERLEQDLETTSNIQYGEPINA